MLADVQSHFGLTRPPQGAGYFETDKHKQIIKELRSTIVTGQLIVISGLVGSGKTVLLRKLKDELTKDSRVAVAKSLSVERSKTTVVTLIQAIFLDLASERDVQIPKQGEKRERDLRDLIKKQRKPVALIVDEAHDLHHKTLVGLKRLMEVAAEGGGTLSIVLAGHPKLRNDLRRPTMEEIGYRTVVFEFDGIMGVQREFTTWLLEQCVTQGADIGDVMEDGAIDMLATRLRTPMQIERHMTRAFEEAYQSGTRPVTAEIVDSVLSRQIDDLEPTLVRHGYDAKALADQFNTRPLEIKKLIAGELDSSRVKELTDEMRLAGIPI